VALESAFVSPIIPYLSIYFGIKESSVVYVNLGFSLVGLLSPFFGMLADKHGKRRAIISSMIFFAIGAFISGWATSPFFFAIGRLIIGIGNLTLGATLVSYVSDFIPYSNRGRSAGILRVAFAISMLISPIFSTNIVKHLDLRYLYWSTALFSLIVLFLSFKLPESHNEDQSDSSSLNISEVISIMRNPITIEFLLIQFLLVISPIILYNFLAIWLKNNFHLGQDIIGYVFTLAAIGTLVGVLLSSALSDKVGKMKFAKLSFILMTVSLIPIPYVNSIYIVIPLLIIYTIGLDGGWSAFQAVASEIYPKRRTVFMTLLYFMNSVCSLIFILLGPSLFNLGGYTLIVWISIITSILSIAILFRVSSNKELQRRLGMD